MKIRLTNNAELDPGDVAGVWVTGTTYRVALKDGTAKQYRRFQLTTEGREALEEIARST